ncbi:hypothetical protein B0E43_02535 [Algoriphagus sp. A40]|nr:hypothetical protein B0E43_02535 [Algoriphagus sp. A40]
MNQRQAISPTDQWVVYDGRNAGTSLGEVGIIGLLDLTSGEQTKVYELANQTPFGPGTGAAIFHPNREEVTFIHGLMNADQAFPYHIFRRSGMALDLTQKDHPVLFAQEARDVRVPFTPGALRGGTHAHSYSGDGEWISYTYNDEVVEKVGFENTAIRELRTIGFMMPGKVVQIKDITGPEEFSGSKFSILAARVTPNPQPGSDEIQKAYEETWLGSDGYTNEKAEKVQHALAFFGDLKTKDGKLIKEIFISDLPNDPNLLLNATGLEGSPSTLPEVPAVIRQRRLSHTEDRKYPGLQGPRQWLRSSVDGAYIYAYMKDENGIVQLMEISSKTGKLRQITSNSFSSDTSFSLSPDEKYLAYGAKDQLYLTEVSSGKTQKIGDEPKAEWSDLRNINWSHSGKFIVYNRTVKSEGGSYFQIFRLDIR